jgi:hypothetical protein
MPSFPARTASSPYGTKLRTALVGFADEACGTLARLIAYVMVLALIAMGGIALWQHLPEIAAAAAALPEDLTRPDPDNLRLRGGL